MGSTTTQGRPATRSVAAVRVAFHPNYGVGTLIADFRSSIPSPSIPLFTLHWPPRDDQCKTRGRVDRYSFHVRLFHPLFHAGLSRRSDNYFSLRVSNCRRTTFAVAKMSTDGTTTRSGCTLHSSRRKCFSGRTSLQSRNSSNIWNVSILAT